MTDSVTGVPAWEITDEMLMAYIDGDPSLTPGQRRRIAQQLARRPDLMQRAESFLYTKGPVQHAYEEALVVPDWLTAEFAGKAKPKPRWQPLPQSLRELFRPGRWGGGLAFAAVGAFLVAGPVGWFLHDAMQSPRVAADRPALVEIDARGLKATGLLSAALESASSGTYTDVGAGMAIKPTGTFASIQGTWCRQYLLSTPGNRVTPTLACREDDGAWRILGQDDVRPAPPANAAAGREPPVADQEGSSAFDKFRDGMRKKDHTLTVTQELALISGRWSRKP